MPPNASSVRVDEPLEIGRVRDVAADGERADPLGLALEHVAAAGEHRDVRALVGERLGDREARARTEAPQTIAVLPRRPRSMRRDGSRSRLPPAPALWSDGEVAQCVGDRRSGRRSARARENADDVADGVG